MADGTAPAKVQGERALGPEPVGGSVGGHKQVAAARGGVGELQEGLWGSGGDMTKCVL